MFYLAIEFMYLDAILLFPVVSKAVLKVQNKKWESSNGLACVKRCTTSLILLEYFQSLGDFLCVHRLLQGNSPISISFQY